MSNDIKKTQQLDKTITAIQKPLKLQLWFTSKPITENFAKTILVSVALASFCGSASAVIWKSPVVDRPIIQFETSVWAESFRFVS